MSNEWECVSTDAMIYVAVVNGYFGELLTAQQASQKSKVSINTIYRHEGGPPAIKICQRRWRYPSDLILSNEKDVASAAKDLLGPGIREVLIAELENKGITAKMVKASGNPDKR